MIFSHAIPSLFDSTLLRHVASAVIYVGIKRELNI